MGTTYKPQKNLNKTIWGVTCEHVLLFLYTVTIFIRVHSHKNRSICSQAMFSTTTSQMYVPNTKHYKIFDETVWNFISRWASTLWVQLSPRIWHNNKQNKLKSKKIERHIWLNVEIIKMVKNLIFSLTKLINDAFRSYQNMCRY